MDRNRLSYLLSRQIDNIIAEDEKAELVNILKNPENKLIVTELISELLSSSPPSLINENRLDKLFDNVVKIDKAESKKTILLFKYYKWLAAASVILIVSLGAFFIWGTDGSEKKMSKQFPNELYKNEIDPANQSVVLTLSDGTTILLDSASHGELAVQGETSITKNTSGIIYNDDDENSEVVYNTVKTQKGKSFHLQLADGTKVWLDALSTIKFPTAFPGEKREVEVTGQVYFEVAEVYANNGLKKKAFIVKAGGQEVEVVGTQFNIQAYHVGLVQTTLIEGVVKVRVANSAEKGLMLKPGEQASLVNSKLSVSNEIDIEQTIAWKNGKFHFNGSSITEIMSELARWYDIEVVYQDKINERFVAKIQRDLPLSKLLELLEMTKQVKFKIDGKKVIVKK